MKPRQHVNTAGHGPRPWHCVRASARAAPHSAFRAHRLGRGVAKSRQRVVSCGIEEATLRTRVHTLCAALALLMALSGCSLDEPDEVEPSASAIDTVPSELLVDTRIIADPIAMLTALPDPEPGSGSGYRYHFDRRHVRGPAGPSLASVTCVLVFDEPAVAGDSSASLSVLPTPAAAAQLVDSFQAESRTCAGMDPLAIPEFDDHATVILCDFDEPYATVLFTVHEIAVRFAVHAPNVPVAEAVAIELHDVLRRLAEDALEGLTVPR